MPREHWESVGRALGEHVVGGTRQWYMVEARVNDDTGRVEGGC